MSFGLLGSPPRPVRPTKRKVFVSYHHAGDQAYYDLFARTFADQYDVVTDNSLSRQIDSDDVDYVIRRIRKDYITGSSCTVVLVGRDTWGRKYVDWEIKATLDAAHGLVGVYLPTAPISSENKVMVPGRLHDNIQSGFALWVSWRDFTQSPQRCSAFLEDAVNRNRQQVVNNRPRRLRNA